MLYSACYPGSNEGSGDALAKVLLYQTVTHSSKKIYWIDRLYPPESHAKLNKYPKGWKN